MMRISKLVIGIRPSNKMFRISSIAGNLIDNLLGMRGQKPIDNLYFTEVSRNLEQGSIGLKNEQETNILKIDMDNIIFTKDYYSIGKKLDIEKAIDEFRALWRTINTNLHVKEIRRIGMVAEHRLDADSNSASKTILEKYTNIETNNHPSKMLLRFEDRKPTKEGGIPDIKKSDFINIIRDYYDSTSDIDHPEDDKINANIDVQRYYSPLLTGNVIDEIVKLKKAFNEERKLLNDELKLKGLI